MRAVLNRIFLRKLGIGKFVFSGIAFLIGFTLVLLSLQGYIKIRSFLKPGKSTSNYVVINKEVVMAHTLLGGRAHFTPEEVNDLKGQPFVEDLGVFNSNTFEVVAHAGGAMGLYTELFFESVPSRFIDNRPGNFTWEEGDEFLPIIISQDFLDLYNFGFAVGKGTPQLSRSTVQLVPVKIEVAGLKGRQEYDGRVVGFSERIPSVLVPEEFLFWANSHVGNPSDQKTSRVIIKLRGDGATALETYLKKNKLVVADEKMRLGKLMSALDIFITAALVIGVGFIVFSLVIIMLNFSLIVAQANEEVSLLLQLGYSGKQLVVHLTGYLVVFLFIVLGFSGATWWLGNTWLVKILTGNGIQVTGTIAPEVIEVAVGFVLMFFAFSYFSISRLIGKRTAGGQ